MDLLVGSLTEIIMSVFSICSLIGIPARLRDSVHLFQCLSIVATLTILEGHVSLALWQGPQKYAVSLSVVLLTTFLIGNTIYTLTG
jgi:hypothetical protein